MKRILFALALLGVILSQTACGNKRVYIGVDDYGEPKSFRHDFQTRGDNDGDRGVVSRSRSNVADDS